MKEVTPDQPETPARKEDPESVVFRVLPVELVFKALLEKGEPLVQEAKSVIQALGEHKDPLV